MAVRTYGTMAVDWEQRVDMDRLRTERLARANQFLKESDL
jgi:Xaa-Pro dipeptidase